MSLIRTRGSSAPFPLLSDADRFELQHPGLVTAARDDAAKQQAAKLSVKAAEADSAAAAAEACWVLLSGVPDSLEGPELRRLVAAASKEPVKLLWERTAAGASPDEGLEFVASFSDGAAATRACAALRSATLPFSAKQWPAPSLSEQTQVVRPEAANDSWRDDSGGASGGAGAESASWRRPSAAAPRPQLAQKEATDATPPLASVIGAGEEVDSWEELVDPTAEPGADAQEEKSEEAGGRS
jgi:hypothetical protein